MDTAYCIQDEQSWDARALSDAVQKNGKAWLDQRRHSFICRGCEQKSKFVDAKKRVPHFSVVFEHDEGCDFEGTATTRRNRAGHPLPSRAAPVGNKEVRYVKPGPLHPVQQAGQGPRAPRGNQARNLPPLHETTSLQALLKNLRNRDDYPPEDLYLDIPGRGDAVRATDYFQRIGGLTRDSQPDGHTRAYWGEITFPANEGPEGPLWINCDGKGTLFTIRIGPNIKADLYGALGISVAGELEGCHVIVEGIMNRNRKLSVSLTAPGHLEKIAFLSERQV